LDTPRRSKPVPASANPGAAGRAWRPSRGRLAIVLALAVAGVALLWLLWMPSGPGPAEVTLTQAPIQARAPAPGISRAVVPGQLERQPEGDADPTPDLSSFVARGENPSMADVIERLHQRGVYSGLGAFSPPGTSPPLVGLAVPEGFDLPKGYVRHHQATDDGQAIEAILMFAPDHQLFDTNNKPIDMPANRVVPPEWAPPGLPLRRIVIPAPTEPARPGR
jgi:hypothetical protein